jgi:gliding motility-associated-like protein
MTTQIRYLIAIGFLAFFVNAFGQDNCATAIPITILDGTCSGSSSYTNVGMTASSQGPLGCFSNVNHDIWFSFVAQATDVTVTINGNNASSGGTLTNPQVGLLSGSCSGTLTMFHCATDVGTNNNGVEMFGGALTIGQTYYIRVDGANQGTFEICVNNYFAPPNPKSDCVDGVILCDKAPFTVQSISGAGSTTSEMNNSPCGLTETNSSWYIWTCDQAGTLEFTLTPTSQSDDLDFVVYELNNGNCNNKTALRCMAAGDFTFPSVCMGPTGLGNGATDVSEQPGCSQNQDSWLAPLNMVSGKTYALVVNNYTSSGNGFNISFGGTGTFLGPKADFVTNPVDNICIGQTVVFTDNSTFPNGSDGFAWNFGVGATPQVASGPGPHTVTYSSLGTKSIALTVESTLGCVVSTVKTIQVNPCCETVNPISTSFNATNITCPGGNTGNITLSGTTGYPPFSYQWSYTGLAGSTANNLYAGNYTVTMTDQIGCDEVLNIPIHQPPLFNIIPTVARPTCGGGTDGSMSLAVSGATPGYTYNYGSGFTSQSFVGNLSNGIYPVTIRDALGCDTLINVDVQELILELDTIADFIFPPTCFGFTNGSIVVSMGNGQAPFQYNWNNTGFTNNNSLVNLGDGTYTLSVIDANSCVGGPFNIVVEEPETLVVNAAAIDVTCYDGTDGEAFAPTTGGNGNYAFNWSNNRSDSLITGLVSGLYRVTVTDFKGCSDTSSVFVHQPPAIDIPTINVTDAYCYGDSNGVLDVTVIGGTPPFEYSLDGINYQISNQLTHLFAGNYTVYVRDALGCEFTKNATVNQPWIFYVQAGSDQTIQLGYEANLQAFVNSVGNTTFSWTPADSLECPTCKNITVSPAQNTTYTVTATDERGCSAQDSVSVFVEILRPYFIPNVFSPNVDGFNDNFYVYGGPAIRRVRTLRIFDRWGGFVFEARDIPANQPVYGWDGKYREERVAPSVFVFYVEIEFVDGFVEIVSGDVTVLK